jgi:hypothetical protein
VYPPPSLPPESLADRAARLRSSSTPRSYNWRSFSESRSRSRPRRGRSDSRVGRSFNASLDSGDEAAEARRDEELDRHRRRSPQRQRHRSKSRPTKENRRWPSASLRGHSPSPPSTGRARSAVRTDDTSAGGAPAEETASCSAKKGVARIDDCLDHDKWNAQLIDPMEFQRYINLVRRKCDRIIASCKVKLTYSLFIAIPNCIVPYHRYCHDLPLLAITTVINS